MELPEESRLSEIIEMRKSYDAHPNTNPEYLTKTDKVPGKLAYDAAMHEASQLLVQTTQAIEREAEKMLPHKSFAKMSATQKYATWMALALTPPAGLSAATLIGCTIAGVDEQAAIQATIFAGSGTGMLTGITFATMLAGDTYKQIKANKHRRQARSSLDVMIENLDEFVYSASADTKYESHEQQQRHESSLGSAHYILSYF